MTRSTRARPVDEAQASPRITSIVEGAAVLAAALVPLAVALTGWTINARQHWVDLDIYLASARQYRSTGVLYCLSDCRQLGFTYPPVAVIPFLALADAPTAVLHVSWTVTTLLVLLHTLRTLSGLIGQDRRWRTLLCVAVLISEPVLMNAGQGQASVLVACMWLLGMTTSAAAGGGLLMAAATALKLTPVLGLVPVVATWSRLEWCRFASAAKGGTCLLLLGLALGPRHTLNYLTVVVPDTSRIGSLASLSNSSISGLLAHWHVRGVIPVVLNALCALGVVATLWLLGRRGAMQSDRSRVTAAVLSAIGACLITPIAWTHHALAGPIAGVLLLAHGRRLAGTLIGASWIPQLMYIAPRLDWPLMAMVQSIRPVGLVAAFVLLTRQTLAELPAPPTAS